MAMWLSENEGVFATPPILPLVLTNSRREDIDDLLCNEAASVQPGEWEEIGELNNSVDSMVAFELSSRDDLVQFCEISCELGFHVRAIFDPNITPSEED